ncbi:hypothetical protein ACWKWP_04140 [Agromyces soli]
MSAVPAQSRPLPLRGAPEAVPPRRLRLVPSRVAARKKPRLSYAVIALGAILLVAAAQLVLSVAMTQGAYELDHLRIEQASVDRDSQLVREQLDALQSPQNLARNAEQLGMVPNTNPVYLRLSDGAVLGVPQAASGGAGASVPLVPNSLIADVPLVNQPAAGENAAVGTAEAPAGQAPAAPPAGALPTPATH